MAEEKDLSKFLDYRPDLKYEKKREIELDERNYSELNPGDTLTEDLTRFVKPSQIRGYIPSPAIMDAIEVTPTQALSGLHGLKGLLADIIADIVKDLRNNRAIMPSVDDYILARQNNDTGTRYAFEDNHAWNIEGDTAAEALPVLLHMQEEADALFDFLNDELFGGQADMNHFDDLVKDEEERLRNLILADQTGQADTDALQEDCHLLDYVNEKVGVLSVQAEIIDDIVRDTINDSYGGQAVEIVEALSDSSLLDSVTEVNEARFDKEAKESEDAKSRLARLSGTEQKMALLKKLRELQKKKLKNRKLLDWMEKKNLEGHDPMMFFLLDVLEGVQEINNQCEMLTNDLYAIVSLEDAQLDDFSNTLRKKNAARQINSVAKDMKQNFKFNDKDARAQAEKFVKHTGLDKAKVPRETGVPMHPEFH